MDMQCLSSFTLEKKCTFSIFILPPKSCICKDFFLSTYNNFGRMLPFTPMPDTLLSDKGQQIHCAESEPVLAVRQFYMNKLSCSSHQISLEYGII